MDPEYSSICGHDISMNVIRISIGETLAMTTQALLYGFSIWLLLNAGVLALLYLRPFGRRAEAGTATSMMSDIV